MIPDKVPEEDVYHPPEELKKEAHISSYDKFKELYLRSIESPDGESVLPHVGSEWWGAPPSTSHHVPTDRQADQRVGRKVPQGSS